MTFKETQSSHYLKNFSLGELESWLVGIGEKKFRARQIFQSFYTDRTSDFAGATTLPLGLREFLSDNITLNSIEQERIQESEDGTKKFLFKLDDGQAIESVLIPSEMVARNGIPKRRTICISTQVGCALGCAFCATATLKIKRNLSTAEIVDQFLSVERLSDERITNVVFMGMGEPLLNYDNVMKAVEIFTDEKNRMLTPRRITLSTAGIVPGIERMTMDNSKIKLALSLHATTDAQRKLIMPIAKKWSLDQLMSTLSEYYRVTKLPVTFEYILFDGFNDSHEDVLRLAKLTRAFPSKVNVIPFHQIDFTHPTGIAAELKPSSRERFGWFNSELKRNDVTVMIRSSSGLDIDAACGQLALAGGK